MLDKKTEMMLSVAATLTSEDLDYLRGTAPVVEAVVNEAAVQEPPPIAEEDDLAPAGSGSNDPSRGERERCRTRKSKIATACVGHKRQKHDWWPVGTELIGCIGGETFTAVVVENPQVKSGKSVKIMSGAAAGRECITPTRAALEATEAYRQANNLGRGGGVTNGWTFWKPRT